MLGRRFDTLSLDGAVKPFRRGSAYPTIADRPVWTAVPADTVGASIEAAERYLDFEYPALPLTEFLGYSRTGNRHRFETLSATRRSALARLVLGEVFESSGRFLDPIIDGIWTICEESSWVYPAHNWRGLDNSPRAVPSVEAPYFDLFAGETAGLLAWTYHLLHPLLDAVSPEIPSRIEYELTTRVTDPFIFDEFQWMGFVSDHPPNNWNPWCNSNALLTAHLCERDRDRRVAVVRRAVRSLDRFLEGYGEDGGCDEGPTYWNRAGGALFDCLEVLSAMTDGTINIYDEPRIRNIGRFIYHTWIDRNWFVNFADAAAWNSPPGDLIYRFGARTGDSLMMDFGAHLYISQNTSQNASRGTKSEYRKDRVSLNRLIPKLLAEAELRDYARAGGAEEAGEAGEAGGAGGAGAVREETTDRRRETVAPFAVRDSWFPSIQVMTARENEGTTRGFYLAAKGGHNGESHNHNDVGSMVAYFDGIPVLIDAGVETYTRQTFSPERYELWTMQSHYHNLPTVGLHGQQAGPEFRAEAVEYWSTSSSAGLSLELRSAYPADAGIKSWTRTTRLTRETPARIEIDDRFALSESLPVTWNFICSVTPAHGKAGYLTFGETGTVLTYRQDLSVSVEQIELPDPKIAASWGPEIYRIRLASTAERNGAAAFTLSQE